MVTGSSRDVSTVRSLLLNDPEIIFSGITSTWKLRFNPFHPIAMDDAAITGDSAAAVMQALKDLVSTNSISNSPIYAPISSTGHGSRRDQPLSLIPLYWWLLKEAQADTAALERVSREAVTQKQSCLGGYIMIRPPLLTFGEMKGTTKVHTGWIWEDDVLRKSDEQETGIKAGYTISRMDLARLMFEELIQGNFHSWNGNITGHAYKRPAWENLRPSSDIQQEVVTLPPRSSSGGPHFRDQEFLIPRSLFKAVTIILFEDNFNIRVSNLAKLPLLITLTGEDSGLSQELNFKSISRHVTKFISDTAVQVPLHTAIDFITAQNQREIAVSGPQPDPLKSTLGVRNGLSVHPEDLPLIVSSLGGGDEPIEGPSSTWVDTTIHTGWPRVNAFDDKRVYQWEEKDERWKMLRQVAGVSLSYVRIRRRKSI
ncbi:hypothetical protein FDENT_9755 [Fusarium denticulatum]|uniref:Uncharacterized protein n=1 Tax=Fusarium denticulatum TaxID=48507 RepID=A0A8H5TN78_9HYPO|nr:hypothetical protein FDENT_9755 [Fusarium denticulatum]